jgi:hypothetical protein
VEKVAALVTVTTMATVAKLRPASKR